MSTTPSYVFLTWENISYSRTGVIFSGMSLYGRKPILKKIILGTIWEMSSEVRRFIQESNTLDPIYVVGSPCGLLVISLRLASPRARIVFDTGWPQVDAKISGKNQSVKNFFGYSKMYFLDFVAFKLSNLIAVESQAQKMRLGRLFLTRKIKLFVSYTGINEVDFNKIPSTGRKTAKENIVIFRGKINAEAGIELLAAISWLFPQNLKLVVISPNIPKSLNFSSSTKIISERVTNTSLTNYYSNAILAIGQLGKSKRLDFTIPHKFYEAAYFGVPYLTQKKTGLTELISANEYELFCHDLEPSSISTLVTMFAQDEVKMQSMTNLLRESYEKKFSQEVISRDFESHTSGFFKF